MRFWFFAFPLFDCCFVFRFSCLLPGVSRDISPRKLLSFIHPLPVLHIVISKSIPASPPRIVLSSVGILAAIPVYYRLMWPTFREFQLAIDFSDIPFSDFVTFYYPMGKEVLLTKAPVVGYHYSQFFALLLYPFGQLPLTFATTIWVYLLVAATSLLIWISFRIASPSKWKLFPLFAGLVFLSFPILHNFVWGQVGVFLTLLILGALYASLKNNDIAAGILLSASVSLKYYPVIFLIPFLISGNRKTILAFVASCFMFLAVIPVLILGWGETLEFVAQLSRGVYAKQIAAAGENSQSFFNVLMRWSGFLGHESQAARFILRTGGYLGLEAVIVLIFFLYRYSIPRSLIWAFVLLSLSVPFFVATSWPHYLVYLPFCQIFIFSEILERREYSLAHRRILFALLFLSVLLASVFALQLSGDWKLYTGAGFLFASNALLTILSVRLVLSSLQRAKSGNATSSRLVV